MVPPESVEKKPSGPPPVGHRQVYILYYTILYYTILYYNLIYYHIL